MKNPVIGIHGTKRWYKDGELHRDDGPAIEYYGGDKEWFKNGKRHRLDGPAKDWCSGKEWWYEDKRIYCKNQEEFERMINLKAFW